MTWARVAVLNRVLDTHLGSGRHRRELVRNRILIGGRPRIGAGVSSGSPENLPSPAVFFSIPQVEVYCQCIGKAPTQRAVRFPPVKGKVSIRPERQN